jgi:23S rRNA pseudouridine1911/1915/1917 synthase
VSEEEQEPSLPPRIEVPPEAAGTRLDTWLSRLPGAPSRNRVQQLVKDSLVLVNGAPAKRAHELAGGEVVEIEWPGAEDDWPWPQDIPLDIVHQDESVIVINKQANLVVHPSAGHPDNTMVNALLHRFPDLPGINGVKRPGIVHRLDRDTTGLIVVAKTERAMSSLARQFQEKTVRRTYLALAIGNPPWESTTVDAAIGRDPVNRLKRAIDGGFPRDAISHFEVVLRSHQFALIRCQLETGRTHQIRIHLKHIGFPIVCDEIYDGHVNRCLERLGNSNHELKRAFLHYGKPFLHSHTLRFYHPMLRRNVYFTQPPPADSLQLLKLIWGEERVAEVAGERVVQV